MPVKAVTAKRKSASASRSARSAAVQDFFHRIGLSMAFQPIVDLRSKRVLGFEALSRFTRGTPGEIWREARELGFHKELEIACVESALEQIERLPGRAYLSVNISPNVALCKEFAHALKAADLSRIVIEVTEEAVVNDYEALAAALAPFLHKGARLALDDVGSGFAGIAHILRLSPSIIKLDLSVTKNLASDPWKKALASSLAEFGAKTNCKIVAEGIETKKEVSLLRKLGITTGQGFLLGRPQPLPDGDSQQKQKGYFKTSLVDLVLVWKRVLTRRLITIPSIALLVGSFLVGPAATAFAENAQPGEALWEAKLKLEDLRLALEDDPAARIALNMEFASRRVEELSSLLLIDGDASSTGLVAKNFAKHSRASIKELKQLGNNARGSRPALTEALTRHRFVLNSLATLACDTEVRTLPTQSRACSGLRTAMESSSSALATLDPSGNEIAQASQTGAASENSGENAASIASERKGEQGSPADVPADNRPEPSENANERKPEGQGRSATATSQPNK